MGDVVMTGGPAPDAGPANTQQTFSEADRLRVLMDDEHQVPRPLPPESSEVVGEPVTAEAVSDAIGASVAERMRARLESIKAESTRDFRIPGWRGDLVLRVRMIDRPDWARAQREGITDESLIVLATRALLIRDGDRMEEIPGAWGPQLAGMLGFPADTPPTRLVAAIMADRGPWISGLASDVLRWLMGRRPEIEEDLGE